MTHPHVETRGGLPHEMQALLRDYPREAWPGHPNFAASIKKWMGAHSMFRDLAWIIRRDTESFQNKEMEDEAYASRLSRFGNLMLRNLHGHHTWEDLKFFPELRDADRRFDNGLEMLEQDHQSLDGLLNDFRTSSNRLIQLQHLDPKQVPNEAEDVRNTTGRIEAVLNRHLSDEEDLVVPILLHHKLRG